MRHTQSPFPDQKLSNLQGEVVHMLLFLKPNFEVDDCTENLINRAVSGKFYGSKN